MNPLALPEIPQLAGILPETPAQSNSGPPDSCGFDPVCLGYKLGAKTRKKAASVLPNWWTDLPRIGTFLLGFLLIAGAIFAPRDIKQTVKTAAKAAAL